jgi:hypothetical protein
MSQRHRLYVPLTSTEFVRLRELAWAERRSPRDHAAVLLLRALGLGLAGRPVTDHATPTPPKGSTAASSSGEEAMSK